MENQKRNDEAGAMPEASRNGLVHEEFAGAEDVIDEYEEPLFVVRASYDYRGKTDVELSFERGDLLTIMSKVTNDWLWGGKDQCYGYIPVNYVTRELNKDGTDWQNEDYFSLYNEVRIHHEMLSDQPRTSTYLRAIRENKSFIKGKFVMDVGCGSGILSLFAAKYGKASQVFAVEASDISRNAEAIVIQNGYMDKIKILNDRIENIKLEEKVDLIFSEWMGTLLISEFMIDSVIIARDCFLKPRGKIWPSNATLHLVPCTAGKFYSSKIDFWNDVYGFDFSALKLRAMKEFSSKPIHDNIATTEDCLAIPERILTLNLLTVRAEDLENIIGDFCFRIDKAGCMQGFSTWFSVSFNNLSHEEIPPIVLDTGPSNSLTHWKHPLLLLDTPVNVEPGDVLSGNYELRRNKEKRRHLAIILTGQLKRSCVKIFSFRKEYKCWQ